MITIDDIILNNIEIDFSNYDISFCNNNIDANEEDEFISLVFNVYNNYFSVLACDVKDDSFAAGINTAFAINVLSIYQCVTKCEIYYIDRIAKNINLNINWRDPFYNYKNKNWDFKPNQVTYDGKSLNPYVFNYSFSNIMHEICHYICARPFNRTLPDYGLGQGFYTNTMLENIPERYFTTNNLNSKTKFIEEEIVLMMQVYIAFKIKKEYGLSLKDFQWKNVIVNSFILGWRPHDMVAIKQAYNIIKSILLKPLIK